MWNIADDMTVPVLLDSLEYSVKKNRMIVIMQKATRLGLNTPSRVV